jgi:hypothetical protein
MERRGYVLDELNPDMLVNIAATMEERQSLRATPARLPGWSGVEAEHYRLGRMAIDLIDAMLPFEIGLAPGCTLAPLRSVAASA